MNKLCESVTMRTKVVVPIAIAALLLLVGCSSSPTRRDRTEIAGGAPVEIHHADGGSKLEQDNQDDSNNNVDSNNSTENSNASAQTSEQITDRPPGMRVILFDFNSSDILPESVNLLQDHGRYLSAHPQIQIILEGHGDERGTREYNLALGERRAAAVRQFLMAAGANADQLHMLSYGEERPAYPEQNEASWSRNRRVELVYEE